MAGKEKRQSRKVKFELSWGGIVGIVVLCFCIFLWMFILGVWTGQSLLQPTFFGKKTAAGEATAIIAPLLQVERVNGKEEK
jgi:hypothetical protein